MIPNEMIDQILDKVDIVEVVSSCVSMKKSGQNFKGLCPFHKEKTPSFMVSPAKQIYHCFGCGAGGNAIGFLMKYENMDFIDAIKILADKANISLPRTSGASKTSSSLAERLYSVNNVACNLYQENLSGGEAGHAYNYFKERGLTDKTIKHFRLGFARDSWQGLINYGKAKDVGLADLEKAGLVLQNAAGGNWYDRFRNRIIFPIFDIRHRVLGFGARTLDTSTPKYINSPETYIYTKGKHLYGLNLSKEQIRRQDYAIIVEGYFDLIVPFQNEIQNVVATLGTALTPEQISALRRFTKNVIMVYDSDKAGEAATLRGLDLLIGEEMNVRIAILPKGYDPDSFVRKEGKVGFMKILKASKDLFDYKLMTLTAKFKKNTPHGKTRIVAEMLPTLGRIKNEVLKSSYLKKTSEALGVDEESVRIELRKIKTRRGSSLVPEPEPKNEKLAELSEITLLAVVLEDARYVEKIEKEIEFSNIKNKIIGSIFERIADFYKNGKTIQASHLINYFENTDAAKIISEATGLSQTINDKNRVFEDCLFYVKKQNLKDALSDIQFKIKEAESSTDFSKVDGLVKEYNKLIKSICVPKKEK